MVVPPFEWERQCQKQALCSCGFCFSKVVVKQQKVNWKVLAAVCWLGFLCVIAWKHIRFWQVFPENGGGGHSFDMRLQNCITLKLHDNLDTTIRSWSSYVEQRYVTPEALFFEHLPYSWEGLGKMVDFVKDGITFLVN